jgi:hypothetical protein
MVSLALIEKLSQGNRVHGSIRCSRKDWVLGGNNQLLRYKGMTELVLSVRKEAYMNNECLFYTNQLIRYWSGCNQHSKTPWIYSQSTSQGHNRICKSAQ